LRTIMEHASTAHVGADVEVLTSKSLAELGWTWPDLGIDDGVLVDLASTVIDAARRAKRDLPVSPESQFIQDAINRKFPPSPESSTGATKHAPSAFAPFSFERYCLEQAILILTQIDSGERQEAFTRTMTIVVGPEFGVYGIMFQANSGGGEDNMASYQTRLRCNDLERLQAATTMFVSAIHPTQQDGAVRRFSSPSVSVGRRMPKHKPFVSEVRRLEIRSVANERLFTGTVVPITGRFSLLRQVLAGRSARVLSAISATLVVISAVLFELAPNAGWWEWTEQLVGRLATGAFGALLVDGAIDYTALRKSLTTATGPVTHGALVTWSRATHS
jgi:hypothetical protein